MTEAESIANDPAVQELRKPPAHLTGRRHGWAKARKIGEQALLLIGLLALAIGVYSVHRSGDTARCVNSTLAARNAPADAEINAQITKARADLAALQEIRVNPTAGFAQYTAAASDFVAALQAVQDARNANPLGKC